MGHNLRGATARTAAAALLTAALIGGCTTGTVTKGGSMTGIDRSSVPAGSAEENSVAEEALVIILDDGSPLFVNQATGTPYIPTLDDAQIVDADGNPIAAADLTSGNVVEVTGNGIMLESYPGQYPGITRVEVIDEGSPDDVAPYADLIEQLSVERDPGQPAHAAIEYTTELAQVTLTPQICSYTWTVEHDGEAATIASDAPSPVQIERDELPDARLDGATETRVSFDDEVRAVAVERWSEDAVAEAATRAGGTAALDPAALPAETVETALTDGEATLTLEPGWRYAITAAFDAGEVTYAFTCR